MTAAEFATHVRYMTRTNSSTLTDAQILALMKIRQDEIAEAILSVDEDILLVPMTTNLVADQREYPFDSDIISRIKRVEAKLDGSNWLYLEELDISSLHYPTASESDITTRFSNLQDECGYGLRRSSIYLYSGTITSVTSGLKAWINTYPQAITDLSGSTDLSIDPSTTTHGIPRPLHEIWARGVIIDYKESREKPLPLTERERSYKRDLEERINTLSQANYDRDVLGSVPDDDGSEY